jgi:hypothetical protein
MSSNPRSLARSGFLECEEKRPSGATSSGGVEAPSAGEAPLPERLGRRLLRYGIVLFLLGLVTGRLVQFLALPRMGLASHLRGVMNGTFLLALGLVWPHLRLRAVTLRAAYWLALAGTYFNWAVTLAAAHMRAFGQAGHAGDYAPLPMQETAARYSTLGPQECLSPCARPQANFEPIV